MESHLLQMRGLKRGFSYKEIIEGRSHLLQMRGLKQKVDRAHGLFLCRIFYRCVD